MAKAKKVGRQSAVGLKYQKEQDKAPRVIAKGRGRIAEEIIKVAKENGVPLKEDPDLIELLLPLGIDEEIPPKLYGVVAEILAYVYRLNQKVK